MTNKEKKIQIALGTYLDTVWNDSNKICNKGDELWDEGKKLWDEGIKLWDKGYKLCDKGRLLFNNAVKEVYGKDIIIQWDIDKCTLSNGQVFE